MCLFRDDGNFIPFLIPHKNVAAVIWESILVLFSNTINLLNTKHLKHILKIQLFQNILIFIIMLTVTTFATDTAIILGNMNSIHTKWQCC